MFKSRPVQYLGLALLVLACLGVIFYPVGANPQPDTYTITLLTPRSFEELATATKPKSDKDSKSASEIAAALIDAEFKNEKTTSGLFTIAANGKEATIEDEVANRGQATKRTERIVKALNKRFPGARLAPATVDSLMALPPTPLLSLGQYAVFPLQKQNGKVRPAVRLGLDLQGGVNLVLQVRRALFSYTFTPPLGADSDARDKFASQVRTVMASAAARGLDESDVNLTPGQNNLLEIRTQAKDRAEFDRQKTAILEALKAQVPGVTFTAREPQFFEPDKSVGEQLGFEKGYSAEILDRTVEIVRSRVDKLGVAEPMIQKQGEDRIIVQLPGVKDPQKAVAVIGTTAQMEIRLLPRDLVPYQDPTDSGTTLFRDAKTNNPIPSHQVRQLSELVVAGKDVKPTTTAGLLESGEPAVFFEMQGEGARKFSQVTGAAAAEKNRYIPIFLDERCISAPTVNERITGSGQISGGFKDIEEARSLALLLNSGALPAPIDIVENRTVSATLGQDSLNKSVYAGLIGLVLVAIYMVAFYRLPGMLANFALAIYCLLNLAVFNLIGGTLTLPGIAGFLLAIAMSLDTNILVFERLKEEMAIQPTFAAALRAAFSRAWTAILDSHVTTLIAAIVLFIYGTGPVKGFALTLGIGVLLSLFSAISVTRLFMWSVAGTGERNRNLFGTATPVAPAPTPRSDLAR